MFLRFRSFITIICAVFFAASLAAAQGTPAAGAKKDDKKVAAKPTATPDPKAPSKPLTVEQVVENALFIYGFGGGRATLNQIRKTTFERGKTTLTKPDGKTEQVPYQRWVIRAENLGKEKIRIDQEFSNSRFGLVYSDEKFYGVFNNTIFNPRDDVLKSFENSIFHGLEALFRYKENESKIELAGREKLMGVDYYFIDVTDKKDRKTRFYVSVKSFRVMTLSYEEGGVKFKRKFYDQKYAQGTLVAYRSVLTADGKMIEEQDLSSVTFGQKVDEELFKAN